MLEQPELKTQWTNHTELTQLQMYFRTVFVSALILRTTSSNDWIPIKQ
jgi:hypothetical protein